MKSEADYFEAYNGADLEVMVQSYKEQIADLKEEIERKQDGGVMDRVRREAIMDLQDDLELKQDRLAKFEAEQKRRAEAVQC
jgi:hypothetical protein